jgi:hypothetical protein
MQSLSSKRSTFVNWLGLFSSFSTLICCALPALLVSIGMGAALTGLISNVPQLIWISENKPLVFGTSGFLIGASALLNWSQRNAPCPIDPAQREACIKGRVYSRRVLALSALIFGLGSYFAFFVR